MGVEDHVDVAGDRDELARIPTRPSGAQEDARCSGTNAQEEILSVGVADGLDRILPIDPLPAEPPQKFQRLVTDAYELRPHWSFEATAAETISRLRGSR